ncbi:hypothetical protein A33M_1435 [Rhodovulum sp. PH10]|nr:hypothetical protein A33M_1435 [Rhodovulum sp. PH10]
MPRALAPRASASHLHDRPAASRCRPALARSRPGLAPPIAPPVDHSVAGPRRHFATGARFAAAAAVPAARWCGRAPNPRV